MTTWHRISFVMKQLELHARKLTTAQALRNLELIDYDTGIFLLVNSLRYVIVVLTFTVNHNSSNVT